MKEEHDHARVFLEGVIKTSWQEGDFRFWRRLKAVSLYEQGYSVEEICNILDVSRRSVFYWVNRYRKLGIRGLMEEYHPGRPRRLAEEELERLGEILDSGPVAYGFSSGIWTCARVGHVIQAEFGVRYHEDHVRKILHELGFSVQRPTKALARADIQWQQRWIRHTYPALKKTSKRKGDSAF